MRKIRNHIQILLHSVLILTLLLSSFGVTVFSHTCEASGISEHSVLHITPCCGEDNTVEKGGCCSTDAAFHQVDDARQAAQALRLTAPAAEFAALPVLILELPAPLQPAAFSEKEGQGKPPDPGRQLSILHQNFRI